MFSLCRRFVMPDCKHVNTMGLMDSELPLQPKRICLFTDWLSPRIYERHTTINLCKYAEVFSNSLVIFSSVCLACITSWSIMKKWEISLSFPLIFHDDQWLHHKRLLRDSVGLHHASHASFAYPACFDGLYKTHISWNPVVEKSLN